MSQPVYGVGATFDGGCFRLDTLLRGHALGGVYAGTRVADARSVLVTVRAVDWRLYPVERLVLASPGIAPLLYAGPPDAYQPKPSWPGASTIGAVIELRPAGSAISDRGATLSAKDVVRVGLGLTAMLAAADPAQAILGIRPETTYIVDGPDGMQLSGVAPRSIRILSHHHDGVARAFAHSYEAPELYVSGDSTPTTDLFSAALTLWAGFTGAHAYRVTADDVDEAIIAADGRGPFPGPPELGRILEGILQADPGRRPSISDVDDELRQLAHHWGVEAPPFPPTWD